MVQPFKGKVLFNKLIKLKIILILLKNYIISNQFH